MNASFEAKYTREVIVEILKRMSELEIASLRDTFSMLPISVADDRDGHMREHGASVAKILSNVDSELTELIPKLVAMIDKFRENLAADLEQNNIREGFLEECRPHDTAFSKPRRSLEMWDAKNQIYRPVKVHSDYTTNEVFMVEDFELEFEKIVERQFKQLEEVVYDKKEFITMFNRYADLAFLVTKFSKYRKTAQNAPADSLRILVEDVNRFASQRFEFYREVKVVLGTKELASKLAHEKYFEAAISVLKKKKDQQLPFKLFGSNLVGHLIAIIEENKLSKEAKLETNGKLSIYAYYGLFSQMLFVVSSI